MPGENRQIPLEQMIAAIIGTPTFENVLSPGIIPQQQPEQPMDIGSLMGGLGMLAMMMKQNQVQPEFAPLGSNAEYAPTALGSPSSQVSATGGIKKQLPPWMEGG